LEFDAGPLADSLQNRIPRIGGDDDFVTFVTNIDEKTPLVKVKPVGVSGLLISPVVTRS
jgi:hypothetical protein